ncbi:MAG: hypothetical protein IH959_04500 [Chloroflexi bacterium]|nr:hypothetical protein [Chloroflexota bacterium]
MHGSKSRKLMVPGAALAGTVMLLVLAWGHSWSEPAAAADAAMHLEVSSGAKACSEPGDTADYCVRVGMQFQLSTVIDKAPAAPGWLVAQSFVDYDDGGDNLTYQKPTYVTDDIDPNVDCGGLKLGSQTTVGEEVHHSCFAGSLVSPQPQTYTGQFVTMTFTCSAGDSVSTVNLVPLNSAQAGGNGAGFLLEDGVTHIPASDSTIIHCQEPPSPTPVPATGEISVRVMGLYADGVREFACKADAIAMVTAGRIDGFKARNPSFSLRANDIVPALGGRSGAFVLSVDDRGRVQRGPRDCVEVTQ